LAFGEWQRAPKRAWGKPWGKVRFRQGWRKPCRGAIGPSKRGEATVADVLPDRRRGPCRHR